MSAAVSLDKQLSSYMLQLSTKQKKAVLTMVKTIVEKEEYNPWKEPGFLAEMDQRIAELESGAVKGDSWEAVKQKARQSVKRKKK